MPVAQIDVSLLDQLMRAFATYPKDAVTIARVERAGRELLKREPLVGYEVLGACAAARGDREESKRHHEAALRLAPYDVNVWGNFMVSLSILNDIEAAREKAFAMGARFSANSEALKSAMNMLTELGLLESAAKFLHTYGEAGGVAADHAWVQAIEDVLSKRGVSEDEFAAAVFEAREYFAQVGVVRPEYSCRYLTDDYGGPGEIAFGLHVRASAEQAREIERGLFRQLAEKQLVAEEKGAISFYVGFADEYEGVREDVAPAGGIA